MGWVLIDISGAFLDGEHVLAAISGGVDSVALFFLLTALRDEGKIRLTAAHFDHRIRMSSGEDAAFVSALCEKWSVPLVMGREDVPARARRERRGIESAARDARHTFLSDVKRRVSADVIALAHHMDDQAETVLMHIFRGCGVSGLKSMREREGEIVRPLLRYKKEDLCAYVASRGARFCEDQTNALADTPRNALRLNVIPEVLKIYPGAVSAMYRLSEIAAREDDYLEAQTSAYIQASTDRGAFGVRLSVETGLHDAILCRAISRLLPDEGECTVSALARLALSGRGAMALTCGRRAEAHGRFLYLLPAGNHKSEEELPLEDGARLMGVGAFRVRPATPEIVSSDPNRQVLSRRALNGAVLRFRRPGDRIYPLGGPGVKKLSDYLIDRKIDRPLRDYLPLVAKNGEILWAVGVGISERAKINGGGDALELTFIPENERT